MNGTTKKITYLVLWVITGVLIAVMLAGILELVSYWIYDELNLLVVLYGLAVVIGALIGFVCGPVAWHKIYVEGLRGKKYIVKD